ncbi:MAG: TIGR03016 family PEP-CTERM system-associated outer membrane protein [Desulfuromonadaceae bacterium]|jgi:hypothetical protein
MKYQGLLIGLLFVTLFVPSLARADFRLTPAFSLREEYDDNIYLDARDEKSDFITTVKPTVNVNWETKFVNLSLNFGLEYEKYLKHSGEDELRPSQGTRLDSTWSLYRDALFLRVTDSFERVAIDEGGKGGQDNKLTNMTSQNRLVINPYLLLQPLRTLEVYLGYEYENLWYSKKDGDDAERHTYSLQLTKELSPRISSILYGGYSQFRPKDNKQSIFDTEGEEEYDRYDARLTLIWNITDYVTLSGNLGRSWIDYEYRGNSESDLYGGQLDYQITRTFSVGTSYQKDIADTVEDGTRKNKRYSVYCTYEDRSKVSLKLFKTESDYQAIDRQDDSKGATLSGDLPITNKEGISWLLTYTDYENNDGENNQTEKYDRYGAQLEFYHQLRLGRLALGYTWNRNESNISDNDYTDNIIFARLALTW